MISFFLGNFDKCVLAIREEHKEKDMSPVVANVFSHANVAKKNLLVVKLIVSKYFLTESEDLTDNNCSFENRRRAVKKKSSPNFLSSPVRIVLSWTIYEHHGLSMILTC